MSQTDLPGYAAPFALGTPTRTTGAGFRTLGWTEAAIALHPLLTAASPAIARVDIAGHGPLLIDVEAGAFWWDTPLSSFPTQPAEVRVSSEPKFGDRPVALEPGRELDALLWLIGLCSFPNELAWWLQRDDRYRVVRWPNFTTLEHTPDQMRMTSMLGYAYMRVDELAAAASVEPQEARRLINAFSLMRILRAESPEIAVAPQLRTDAASAPKSLFRRLRDRLGI